MAYKNVIYVGSDDKICSVLSSKYNWVIFVLRANMDACDLHVTIYGYRSLLFLISCCLLFVNIICTAFLSFSSST